MDDISPTKKVTIFPSEPWVTKEILNKKKRIFLSGSEADKGQVNREVKLKYKEICTQPGSLKNMAAVNTISTSRKPIQAAGSSWTSIPNDLNSFFTRFEKDSSSQLQSAFSTLKPGDSFLIINTEEVVRALNKWLGLGLG